MKKGNMAIKRGAETLTSESDSDVENEDADQLFEVLDELESTYP